MIHNEVQILFWFGMVVLAVALMVLVDIWEAKREEKRWEFFNRHGHFPTHEELKAEK